MAVFPSSPQIIEVECAVTGLKPPGYYKDCTGIRSPNKEIRGIHLRVPSLSVCVRIGPDSIIVHLVNRVLFSRFLAL